MPHPTRDIEDLSFLTHPLPVVDDPGADTMDPDFREICDLAHASEFSAAADKIEPLLAEGVYDLRLVTIYFLARFVSVGLPMLEPILGGIQGLVGINLEAFGPALRREQHLDKRVAWTLATLTDQGTYHQGKGSEDWERWVRGITSSEIDASLARAKDLSQTLARVERSEAASRLVAFTSWLEDLRGSLFTPEPSTNDHESLSEAAPIPEAAHDSFSGVAKTVPLGVSHAFVELARKLRAFEQLIERERFQRAAVVSTDIMAELDDFDPRRYFPEFFARYGRLVHEHVEQLVPFWSDSDTPQHRSLAQFYRVDLAAFVGGDED